VICFIISLSLPSEKFGTHSINISDNLPSELSISKNAEIH